MADNKILVMGASGKIGLRITEHFLKSEKYAVIAQCRKHCSRLRGLDRKGGRLVIVRHDFLERGVKEFIIRLHEEEPIMAAVIIEPAFHQELIKDTSKAIQEYYDVIRLDLFTPLALIRSLWSEMEENGAIVVLTDLFPIRGADVYKGLKPSLAQIAASAGIQSVINNVPKILGGRIRIYGIALGWMNLERKESYLNGACEDVPLGRGGSVEELINLITYLIESAPKYLTGSVIKFSGGL